MSHSIHNEQEYRRLYRTMIISIIFISFAPLLIINGIIAHKFNTSYKAKVIAHLKETVERHKQNINMFPEEKLSNILVLSKSYSIDQLARKKFLDQQLEIFSKEYQGTYVDLGLINEQGIQIAYAGPFQLEKADYSQAGWFKKCMQNQIYISDVFHGLRGLPHFIVAVRIDENDKKWILRATIDFMSFNNLVENIRVGETGLAYIINDQGKLQTQPRVQISKGKNFYKDLIAKSGNGESVNIFNSDDPEKGEMIYLITPLKKGEWFLVYQQSSKDAFSDIYQTRQLSIFLLTIGAVIVLGVAYLLSRKMVQQIKKSDEEKEMMNEQVVEAGKLASLGELSAGIAHEINNPVAIMVEEAGWIEDLLEEEEFEDSENLQEFKRALKQIRQQGSRCKQITHKLLSFARKIDTNIQNIQINDLIEEVISLSKKRAMYSKVELQTKLSPGLPETTISPSEMQQVLLNMINNSLDAMDPQKGGTVTISTLNKGSSIHIDVSDTGEGIASANLSRIFDPFFTTKPVGKGTGLGLSICYGIIKKMGGDITVDSTVGTGTVFHIKIPVTEQDT